MLLRILKSRTYCLFEGQKFIQIFWLDVWLELVTWWERNLENYSFEEKFIEKKVSTGPGQEINKNFVCSKLLKK